MSQKNSLEPGMVAKLKNTLTAVNTNSCAFWTQSWAQQKGKLPGTNLGLYFPWSQTPVLSFEPHRMACNCGVEAYRHGVWAIPSLSGTPAQCCPRLLPASLKASVDKDSAWQPLCPFPVDLPCPSLPGFLLFLSLQPLLTFPLVSIWLLVWDCAPRKASLTLPPFPRPRWHFSSNVKRLQWWLIGGLCYFIGFSFQ